MTGRSHLLIGTTAAGAGATLVGATTATAAVVITAATASSSLPDWDLKVGLPHRGPTHTLIAWVLVSAVFAFGLSMDAHTAPYAWTAAIGVLIGYGMHLAADACTPRGVPFFSPFYRRDVHLLPHALRITTGSIAEIVIVTVLAAGSGLLVYSAYV